MTDKTADIVERLRIVLADQDRETGSQAALPLAELRSLLERVEALQDENEELRRRAAKGGEMLDAASNFLEAYGRKYRNLAGGGMRPTAILFREVELMWAIHNDFRTLTENASRPAARSLSAGRMYRAR